MRDVMLSNDDLDVDAEVVWMAQHFNHASNGMLAIFWKFEDLDVDDHAIQIARPVDGNGRDSDSVASAALGRDLHACGNIDPLADAVVMRDHVGAALAD